jgi:hypothetical protein
MPNSFRCTDFGEVTDGQESVILLPEQHSGWDNILHQDRHFHLSS